MNSFFRRIFRIQIQSHSALRLISSQTIYDYNVKIGALGRSGKVEVARHLFDKMPVRDVVSWNTMIAAYWQNGDLENSKKMFEMMPEKNVVSWNSMMAGCIEHRKIHEALNYFHEMPVRNIVSWNAMLSGYLKFEMIDEAVRLFQEMPARNVISYTAMIDGYARLGEIERARDLFDYMPKKNAVSWAVMINGYVENEKFPEAKEVFNQMPQKSIVAFTSMITGYCKEGNVETARTLFDEIQEKDIVSWNAMMSGYVNNGYGEEALKLHSQMLQRGIKSDHSTFIAAFAACSLLTCVQQGRQIHTIMIKNGFESNISVCNALITMYSKCGSITDSEVIFEQMHDPDVVSWNAIMAGYSQHGFYNKALALFDKLVFCGLKPDELTFLSILSVCGHAGKVEDSRKWFDTMVHDYKIEPRAEHYACLVDILSRSGQLDKAYEVILEMPFQADIGVWGALLRASGVYLNVELGEFAARKIIELEPQNSGAYVMLSNIYAASGRWREVLRVRGLMKEKRIKKQPGFSWLEIGDRVHLFLGGDVSHPKINLIYEELEKICLHMSIDSDIEDIMSI